MKEVIYKGHKCLIVYEIPILNKKGVKQIDQESVYLSHPFNKIVPKKDL